MSSSATPVEQLRAILSHNKIDALVIPTADAHQVSPPQTTKSISHHHIEKKYESMNTSMCIKLNIPNQGCEHASHI